MDWSRCTPMPAQVTAGAHDIFLMAVDGPASLVVRDPGGAVLLERRAVQHEQGEGPSVHGSSEAVVLDLRPGDHTVECRPDGASPSTGVLRVTAG